MFGSLLKLRTYELTNLRTYLLERDDPAGGKDKLPTESPDNYATVTAKFDEYLQKRDSQLMREKFWLHLEREPPQTFDSWVVTV